MKVSVLVPVYGVEKYIRACARTLFGQTYKDLEYIFVDDCSPDHSVEVLQRVLEDYPLRKTQVRIIHNERNRGLGATRSIALAAATGDFVIYVDSDDLLTTDAVEKLCHCQHETGADIVSGAYRRLLSDESKGDVTLPFRGNPDTILRLMLAQNTISHNVWGRLIRRSLHTDHNVDFIDGINMAEDFCIMTRLMFVATTHACVDDTIYYYRVNECGTFMSWLTEKHMRSYLEASRVIGEFLTGRDTEGRFTFPYELGMLNSLYHALAVFKRSQIEAICPYHPTHKLFRCCRLLSCCRCIRPLLRVVYLVIKNQYVKRCHK